MPSPEDDGDKAFRTDSSYSAGRHDKTQSGYDFDLIVIGTFKRALCPFSSDGQSLSIIIDCKKTYVSESIYVARCITSFPCG